MSGKTSKAAEKCQRRVFSGKRTDMLGHRCGKPAKVQECGFWLCHLHTAEGVAKRDEALNAKYALENAARRARYAKEELDRRKAAAFDGLLNLLIESQTSIGGDWRERRDAVIAEWAASPEVKESL